MVRIIECAASSVLLVIPDDSHVWRRMAEAREQARKLRQDVDARGNAESATAQTRGRSPASS
ncbi:MAG: hypothetical protein HXY21_12075 [Parvularculaceae bacterium]|nr:hypothetical protein [Parvularculaceae bacterium]